MGIGKPFLNHANCCEASGQLAPEHDQHLRKGIPTALRTTVSPPLGGGRNAVRHLLRRSGARVQAGSFDPSVLRSFSYVIFPQTRSGRPI